MTLLDEPLSHAATFTPDKLFISIACGITIRQISEKVLIVFFWFIFRLNQVVVELYVFFLILLVVFLKVFAVILLVQIQQMKQIHS